MTSAGRSCGRRLSASAPRSKSASVASSSSGSPTFQRPTMAPALCCACAARTSWTPPSSTPTASGCSSLRHTIHRGQHEIGGMCIEVVADDGTRVLLDLGMPLTAPDGGDFPWGTPRRPTAELLAEGILRDVAGVFPGDPMAPGVAAIILTHSHLDHFGLAHHAHPAIPVYGSARTIAILEVGRVY